MHRFRLLFGTTTDGERCLALAYVVVGLFGAGMAFVAVTQLGHGEILARPMLVYEKWIVLCGLIGGICGLYLAGDRMGQPGWSGHLRAVYGAGIVSFAGPIIAGTLALPVYGTMFGPFTMAMIFFGSPMVGLLWLANLMAAHLLIGAWRAERDSVFAGATA